MLFWSWLACTNKAPPQPMAAAQEAAPAEPPVAGAPFVSTVYAEHPLVGRIWSTSKSAFVSEGEMLADLRQSTFVMLGEKHDNADHHRLQGAVIAALAPKAVAFEMLDHDDPVAGATDPASLAAAVAWEDSGWPPFALYEPVFTAVYGAQAAIIAAHPTRDEVKLAMREGFQALAPEAIAGLPLDRTLTEADKASLSEEIVASHCGHASPEVVDMMIRGQTLKDAWMARALTAAGSGALVAGGGHTRKDRGVPHYLDGTVKTVLFTEVASGKEDPAPYDESADYLWFTPRVDDIDPCEKFKEQLEKMSAPAPAP